MKAVKVAASLLKVFDPLFGLVLISLVSYRRWLTRGLGSSLHGAYLSDHHMAVEGTLTMWRFGGFNMGSYLGHDRGPKSHIRHEMTIHLPPAVSNLLDQTRRVAKYDINMEPVCAMTNSIRTGGA